MDALTKFLRSFSQVGMLHFPYKWRVKYNNHPKIMYTVNFEQQID